MNEPPDERDETPREEFRRRTREIIMRHHVSSLQVRAERIAEADTEEEVREISSEYTAPPLDELLLLEAEMADRYRPDDGTAGED